MTWFNILFFAVLIFFVLKTIASFVFGEVDMDVDADGDLDGDISTFLSFKGFLHFMLGFSTYLTTKASSTVGWDVSYSFGIVDYAFAVGLGLVFVSLLAWLYKQMMKLNHAAFDANNLNGSLGTVTINLGGCAYEVLVYTPEGTVKRTCWSETGDIEVGTEVTLQWKESEKKYYISI